MTGLTPSNPSESESLYPASITSRQPSSSESISKILGIPSLSVSPPPSSVSRIPSLSSSKSSISGTLSLSLSGSTVSLASEENILSEHTNAEVTTNLYRLPSIICSTLSIDNVVESRPE